VSKISSACIIVHESRDWWPIKFHGAFAIEAAIYYFLYELLARLLIRISTMDNDATPFPRTFKPPHIIKVVQLIQNVRINLSNKLCRSTRLYEPELIIDYKSRPTSIRFVSRIVHCFL
jgi:hypothetical protein